MPSNSQKIVKTFLKKKKKKPLRGWRIAQLSDCCVNMQRISLSDSLAGLGKLMSLKFQEKPCLKIKVEEVIEEDTPC